MAATTQRIRFDNILYATDFSRASRRALPYALVVAKHYGAAICIVHALSPELSMYSLPESTTSTLNNAQASAERSIQQLVCSGVFGDVPHHDIVRQGEVWDVLSAVLREHDIDLIVIGTRGRRGLGKLIMGSVAEEVFRLALCPVLTVGPQGIDTPPQQEVRRILFATDFSVDSIRAMKYATSFAEEFQACLTVMHVTHPPELDPSVKMRLTEFFSERLREVVPTDITPWCSVDYAVEFGTPSEAILRVCRERGTELIIMGVRGAGAMLRGSPHFGTTVYRVVTEAHCPVLTVRG